MDKTRSEISSLASTFRTPKADTFKPSITLDRPSGFNKENLNQYGDLLPTKKYTSPKFEVQPLTQKVSALDRRSFNFENMDYGVKKTTDSLSTTINASTSTMFGEKNSYTAQHLAKLSKKNEEDLKMGLDNKIIQDSSRYVGDTPKSAKNRAPPAKKEKLDEKHDTTNVYTRLLSSLTLGSPKQHEVIDAAMKLTSPTALSGTRKGPQRISYDFATFNDGSRGVQSPTSEGPSFRDAKKKLSRAGGSDAIKLSSVDLDDYYKQNTQYGSKKTPGADKLGNEIKKPEVERSKSSAPLESKSSKDISTYLAGIRNNAKGVSETPRVNDLTPKHTEKTQANDRESTNHKITKSNSLKLEKDLRPVSALTPTTTKNSDSEKYSSVAISKKLEEYASSLKKLEERIFKDKNEVVKGIKTSNALLNNFFKEDKKDHETTQTQAAKEAKEKEEKRSETTPPPTTKSQAVQSYMEVLQKAQSKTDFGNSSIDKRIKELKALAQASHEYLNKDAKSPQASVPSWTLTDKDYQEYIKNKNAMGSDPKEKPKEANERPRENWFGKTSSFRSPAARDNSSSNDYQTGFLSPKNMKKPEEKVTSPQNSSQGLKDFVTQVNPGGAFPSGLSYTQKPMTNNAKEETEKTKPTMSSSMSSSTLSARVRNPSPKYERNREVTKIEAHMPQTTKHHISKEKENQRVFLFSNKQHSDATRVSFQKTKSNYDDSSVVSQKPPNRYYMYNLERYFKNLPIEEHLIKLYRDHFLQTCQGINFSKIVKPVDPKELAAKKVYLPKDEKYKHKKTIVFDLDETLIHCNENASIPCDVILPIKFPSGDIIEAGINVRPYARECLEELSREFELIVFTASHSCYGSVVLDYLDPHRKLIQYRLYRDSCVSTPEGLFVKDLRVIANRDLKDLVLVDNAAYSFSYQVENGIPIIPFYNSKNDTELRSLVGYLKSLSNVKDVRQVNLETFRFKTYLACSSPEEIQSKLFS